MHCGCIVCGSFWIAKRKYETHDNTRAIGVRFHLSMSTMSITTRAPVTEFHTFVSVTLDRRAGVCMHLDCVLCRSAIALTLGKVVRNETAAMLLALLTFLKMAAMFEDYPTCTTTSATMTSAVSVRKYLRLVTPVSVLLSETPAFFKWKHHTNLNYLSMLHTQNTSGERNVFTGLFFCHFLLIIIGNNFRQVDAG